MKQYCRYCVHCIEGDVFFCANDGRTMSEAEIKRVNNCPNFMLTEDIITGREYTPREYKPKGKQVAEEMQQLSFEGGMIMNITLGDLRNMFCKATKIVLVNDIINKGGNYISTERIEVNNLLWGTPTFSGIPVELYRVQAIGRNAVEVTTSMPNEVFAAWKTYAENNLKSEED